MPSNHDLHPDEFRLYEWVKTDGRRNARRHSNRATEADNPTDTPGEQTTLSDGGDDA